MIRSRVLGPIVCRLGIVCCVGIAGLFCPPNGLSQQPTQEIKLTADGFDPASVKDVTFSEAQSVKLTCEDQFEISARYYAGVHGTKTPVVILVHDMMGTGDDLTELAEFLQRNYGYAVIVPDLRGHGSSRSTGTRQIDPEKMGSAEFAATEQDVEACKRFLRERNNEGQLNIDMLAVVGVGKSCITLVNWALTDWSYPVLAGKKQGQDVKALVLVSPEHAYRSVRMTNALRAGLFTGKDFDRPLRVLLAAGTNDPSKIDEIRNIAADLSRGREPKGSGVDGVWLFDRDYTVNGAELTTASAGDLQTLIGQLVFFEIYQKHGEMPWSERGLK
jgi:pimeloyl-ACP methyl ester carboxylesterase